ncbi:MAG: cation:proton antiporter [Candidatus Binatia bacterium]
MEILYILLVLLVVTRFFGELAERAGQPALVGELVSGIVLGLVVGQYAATFPILSGLTEDRVFIAMTDLGIFFLMLFAGIEMHPSELARASQKAVLIAVGGMVVPLALGIGVGWWVLPASELKAAQALFVGVALAITAVPVSIKILMDLGKLDTEVGKIIVSAAVIDDILSLILLAILTAVIKTGALPGLGGLALLGGKILLFFAITIGLGYYAFPRLDALRRTFQVEEFAFSSLLIIALGYAVLAEALNLHFILGAFVAGLFFIRQIIDEPVYDDLKNKVAGLTKGFFAPVFFASIGLHLDLSALTIIPLFVLGIIVAATVGKLVGTGIPAYWAGLSRADALAVGFGMNARGAVELIIADIAFRAGLFSQPTPTPDLVASLFSAIVIMAIVTTLLAPVSLRLCFRRAGAEPTA